MHDGEVVRVTVMINAVYSGLNWMSSMCWTGVWCVPCHGNHGNGSGIYVHVS